jgi:hypothetical protein
LTGAEFVAEAVPGAGDLATWAGSEKDGAANNNTAIEMTAKALEDNLRNFIRTWTSVLRMVMR